MMQPKSNDPAARRTSLPVPDALIPNRADAYDLHRPMYRQIYPAPSELYNTSSFKHSESISGQPRLESHGSDMVDLRFQHDEPTLKPRGKLQASRASDTIHPARSKKPAQLDALPCPLHPSNRLGLCCIDCYVSMCDTCLVQNHMHHRSRPLHIKEIYCHIQESIESAMVTLATLQSDTNDAKRNLDLQLQSIVKSLAEKNSALRVFQSYSEVLRSLSMRIGKALDETTPNSVEFKDIKYIVESKLEDVKGLWKIHGKPLERQVNPRTPLSEPEPESGTANPQAYAEQQDYYRDYYAYYYGYSEQPSSSVYSAGTDQPKSPVPQLQHAREILPKPHAPQTASADSEKDKAYLYPERYASRPKLQPDTVQWNGPTAETSPPITPIPDAKVEPKPIYKRVSLSPVTHKDATQPHDDTQLNKRAKHKHPAEIPSAEYIRNLFCISGSGLILSSPSHLLFRYKIDNFNTIQRKRKITNSTQYEIGGYQW